MLSPAAEAAEEGLVRRGLLSRRACVTGGDRICSDPLDGVRIRSESFASLSSAACVGQALAGLGRGVGWKLPNPAVVSKASKASGKNRGEPGRSGERWGEPRAINFKRNTTKQYHLIDRL